jgi:hypothetical protein
MTQGPALTKAVSSVAEDTLSTCGLCCKSQEKSDTRQKVYGKMGIPPKIEVRERVGLTVQSAHLPCTSAPRHWPACWRLA